jgi:uncharacterized protein YceK
MVKKVIILLVIPIILSGCATAMEKQLRTTPISPETATLVFYTEESLGWGDVFVDRKKVGELHSYSPVQIEVEPGEHIMWVKRPLTIAREISIDVSPNKIYYFKTIYVSGFWTGSIFLMQTPQVSSYTAMVPFNKSQ